MGKHFGLIKKEYPSVPWLDSNDLREAGDVKIDGKRCTDYWWRDTSIVVRIRNEDNEIIDIHDDIRHI